MKDFEIDSYKDGNWFINCGTISYNNGLPNQEYKLCINANIEIVRRLSDGKAFIANNKAYRIKHSNTWIYITHFWVNGEQISCAGYYKKHKEPYNDSTIRHNYFSPNLCYLKDLL